MPSQPTNLIEAFSNLGTFHGIHPTAGSRIAGHFPGDARLVMCWMLLAHGVSPIPANEQNSRTLRGKSLLVLRFGTGLGGAVSSRYV